MLDEHAALLAHAALHGKNYSAAAQGVQVRAYSASNPEVINGF